jgi:rhodanese-related sulfurtransferase
LTAPSLGQDLGMTELSRTSRTRSDDPQNLPRPADEPDLVTVDTTWGKLQPMQAVPGIRTVGELEVAELVREGAQLVDTRVPDSRSGATLPGAVNVPHGQVLARRDELDPSRVHILFCNGPQCPQTPDALRTLSEDGYPVDRLAYYRGGMHDWITLGMPTQQV